MLGQYSLPNAITWLFPIFYFSVITCDWSNIHAPALASKNKYIFSRGVNHLQSNCGLSKKETEE
jgi:hypothetical protein